MLDRRTVKAARLLLAAAMLVLAATAPAVARVDGACARGQGWEAFRVIENGAVRLDAWLARYPTNALAIDHGIYTLAELEADLWAKDRNGNEWICVKDVNAFTGGKGQGWTFWVNAVDDNPAPR